MARTDVRPKAGRPHIAVAGVEPRARRDSLSPLERRYAQRYRERFARLLSPLLRLLMRLRVSPHAISAVQIGVAASIPFVLGDSPQLGFGLVLVALFLDNLDGALARAYHRANDFGALVDQVADHIKETLIVVALALHAGLHIAAAVLYPMVLGMFNLLLLLCNQRGVPVRWVVKPYLTLYPAFFAWAFFNINVITPALVLELALMSTTILIALWKLRRVMEEATV